MQPSIKNIRDLSVAMLFSLILYSVDLAAAIRIGMSSTADSVNSGIYVWVRTFADELERGGIQATIYPSSTLGNEMVRSNQVLMGLLEVNVTGTQEIEVYSKLIAAIDLPFFFKNNQEAAALFHHTGFQLDLNQATTPHGIRVVDLTTMGGMSGLFTARAPIKIVKDISKFRMRAMVAEQIDWVERWGGAATHVAWEEVPQALQTGIVDGYINPPIVAILFAHGGQLDYFTDIAITPSVRVVVFSEVWYQGLSAADREVVDHAVEMAGLANRAWTSQAVEREYALLNSIGIEVVQLTELERAGFREPLLQTYKNVLSSETLEIIEQYMQKTRLHLLQHLGEVSE